MRTETYEIVMPEKCRVMTEEEMEYEGGFFNFGLAAVLSVVSVACDFAVSTGFVKGNAAKALTAVSYGCTVGAAVCSLGGTALLCAGSKSAATLIGKKVVKQAATNATRAEAKSALCAHGSLCVTAYETGLVASGKSDYGAGSAAGLALSLI